MEYYFQIFILAIPAFIANMLPIMVAHIPILKKLNYPLDANLKWNNKELLGKNKTWRGLITGTIGAIISALIIYLANKNIFFNFNINNYSTVLLYGFLAGLGALLGDAFKSLIKRRLNIASGHPFFPFDQIDYIIGFLFFTSLIKYWAIKDILFLFLLAIIFNPLTNYLSYKIKIKNTYW